MKKTKKKLKSADSPGNKTLGRHSNNIRTFESKMSDKDENPKSRPNSEEEASQEKSSTSHSLKSATNLLKAEALRRLQLADAEYDGEENGEPDSSREQTDVSNTSNTDINGVKSNPEHLATGQDDGSVQKEGVDDSSSGLKSELDASKDQDGVDNINIDSLGKGESVVNVPSSGGDHGKESSSKADESATNDNNAGALNDGDKTQSGEGTFELPVGGTGANQTDLKTVDSLGGKSGEDKTTSNTLGGATQEPGSETEPGVEQSKAGDKTDSVRQSGDQVTDSSAVGADGMQDQSRADTGSPTVNQEDRSRGEKSSTETTGDLDKSLATAKPSQLPDGNESQSKDTDESKPAQSGKLSGNAEESGKINDEVSPPVNDDKQTDAALEKGSKNLSQESAREPTGSAESNSTSGDNKTGASEAQDAAAGGAQDAGAGEAQGGGSSGTQDTVGSEVQDPAAGEEKSPVQSRVQDTTETVKDDAAMLSGNGAIDGESKKGGAMGESQSSEPGETAKAQDQETDKVTDVTKKGTSGDLKDQQGNSAEQGDQSENQVSRETSEVSKSSTREAADSSLKGKDDNNNKEQEGSDKKKKSKKDKTKEQKSVDKTEENTAITEDTDNAPEDGKQSDAGDGLDGDEEERVIPDDFYYNFDELVSKPFVTEGIPSHLLTLHHSFGYECTKRSNLHVIDENTVLFSAGNSVEILDLQTQKQTHIHSTSGGGIGALSVHPSRKYFAVAEKGDMPNINIYEYPSLKLYRILREGTEKAYAHLDFNPKGDKLASVGSTPDYMLTVWDWKNEKIILRSKAFSQDVHRVAFAAENEGHLCSTGLGHIRFWTMANTFTGLKLQGEIGKFGTKELSDIEGFVEMPDGKVLSGCEWGNMLLWDGGLITVEICKKGKKPCHNGMIQQFFMDEGELITIGVDGYIKVWDFESIDNADTSEEGMLFEMDPMYELKVGTDVKLMSMVKATNSDDPIWFAQDAGGGIWKLDLSFTHTSHAPNKMFSYHAGTITGLDTSPVAHFVATTGVDNTVRVYDYVAKSSMCQAKYNSGGSSLLWLPRLVDPNGSKILAGFADGVVRLLNLNKADPSQARTKKQKSNYELSLGQVFKPHTKPVTTITVDEQGEILATGSEDCTVFFFTVGETYKPIGFVETASPVVSLVWSRKGKKSKTLLVSCRDGTVLEVEAPEPGNYDTSKSYYLPLANLKITEFQFKSIKEKLRKAEEEARKAKEEEAKRKKKEEERLRRRARGLEEEEEETEETEDEEEEEEKEEEEKEDHGPPQAITAFYHGNKDNFWLSMDGWDAGYLYECQFEDENKPPPPTPEEDTSGEPIRALPVDNSNDVPIRSFCFSRSKKFFLLGMDDGILRIHPLEKDGELKHLSNFWSFSIHDNHHGNITNLATSFDDKYVFSVGADGNFFAFKFMDAAVKGLKVPHRVSIPSAKKLIGDEGEEIEKKVDDIDDPNFYSIEMERQKAEHDRMMKLAEEKKQNVRRAITQLRRNFKQLLNRNQELPSHVQLSTQEFEIDPEIRRQQEAKTEEKIELVKKEMSWDAEKHAIGLRKLQKRFKDEIECDRIVLRAFQTPHKVSTFRSSKPDYLQQLIQEAEDSANRGAESAEGMSGKKGFGLLAKAAGFRRRSTQEKIAAQQQAQQQQQQQVPSIQSQLGGKVAKALEKAEARKRKRLARQAQWDELYRNKPDENYQDPKDVAAIKEARENMGDYKLKTAKDYVVPESQRVNADKKRVQLLGLLEQIHQYKFDYNQKFLTLREKKIRIIKEIKEAVVSLEKLQTRLDPFIKRPIPEVPEMKPDECPERRLEFTREKLLQFKKEIEAKTASPGHDDGGGGGFGGFGGFGGGGGAGGGESKLLPPGSKPGTQQRDRSVSSVSLHSTSRPRSSVSAVTDKESPELAINEQPEELSPLQQQIQYEEQIRLQYDQDVMLDGIKSMLDDFDAELRTLHHDKLHLEVALKSADLRQVTLFEEYMLLKEFEKRENIFANKVDTKLDEKEEMQEKVEDCQMKLENKKQDIEKLQEQEKALYATFASSLGENNKFENFLTRVFKKKIKRAKKKAQTEEGSDEDSEDDESDDDFSSTDEDDSDAEELDDSVCPPGCDQSLFDQVCQLREKRLDFEELLVEEKKTSETLKKEYDALVKKTKVIDSALKTAEADLEAFQREKQQKLNELDVVVVLRLHQVQHMVNGFIAQDLSPCLVFKGKEMVRLQQRIKELDKEKGEQRRLYREHRQTHVQLIRDKKGMESKIEELEDKVKDMQMLKFGRLVDLAKLETVSVNRTVEELKEKLRQEEMISAREIAKWDGKIDSYKEKVTQLTRENTQRLDTYTVLLHEKKELEQMLDSRQKSLGTEFSGARKADLRERQRLVQLVQLQAQEIDALKDEITLLSRKGGHILPPAQPPLPPGHTPIPNQL